MMYETEHHNDIMNAGLQCQGVHGLPSGCSRNHAGIPLSRHPNELNSSCRHSNEGC